MSLAVRRVALIVLDGWGIAPPGPGNAVASANTPVFDRIWSTYLHTTLAASGEDVGLPAGQMGNSEVGHLNLGAGYVVRQELMRIDEAVATGTLTRNEVLKTAFSRARERGGALHLIGLLGDGGVHSHDRHLIALMDCAAAAELPEVWLHPLTDGRDTAPDSARRFLRELKDAMAERGVGRIATIGGRYFAMDRDQRWTRVERAWRAMVDGEGPVGRDALAVIADAHEAGTTDEFIPPTVLIDESGQPLSTLAPEDVVVLYNFRADRMRQLLQALTARDFDHFERHALPSDGYDVVTMTEYIDGQKPPAVFPPDDVAWPLARVVAEAGLTQFHAAETEKYAHVTYFINGGQEEPFHGEERLMVPSPTVATYDLQPEMSAPELCNQVVKRIQEEQDALLVVNFANPDMVGHTGNMEATILAVETVDGCLGLLLEELAKHDIVAIVTADHGNAEQMIDPVTGGVHTAHTTNRVPLVIVDPMGAGNAVLAAGRLADVAPTILTLLNVRPPASMTGRTLWDARVEATGTGVHP